MDSSPLVVPGARILIDSERFQNSMNSHPIDNKSLSPLQAFLLSQNSAEENSIVNVPNVMSVKERGEPSPSLPNEMGESHDASTRTTRKKNRLIDAKAPHPSRLLADKKLDVTVKETEGFVVQQSDNGNEPAIEVVSVTRVPVTRSHFSSINKLVGAPKEPIPTEKTNSTQKMSSVQSPSIMPVAKESELSIDAPKGKGFSGIKTLVSGVGNLEVKPKGQGCASRLDLKNEVGKSNPLGVCFDQRTREAFKRRLSARAKRSKRRSKRKNSTINEEDEYLFVHDLSDEVAESNDAEVPVKLLESTDSEKVVEAKQYQEEEDVKIWRYGHVVWAKVGKYDYWPAIVVNADAYKWLKGDHSKERPKNTITVHFFADGNLADVKPTDIHDFETNRHLQAYECEKFAYKIEEARIAADFCLEKFGHSYPRPLSHQYKKGTISQEKKKIALPLLSRRNQDSISQKKAELEAEVMRLKQAIGNEQEKKAELEKTLQRIRGLVG